MSASGDSESLVDCIVNNMLRSLMTFHFGQQFFDGVESFS